MAAAPVDRLQDWIFQKVHRRNLVYNTCWEDPRCDRSLLDFDSDSKVVMITSAGCNALDYLLDEPAKIHCIDMNPRQNALLQLKLATFRNSSFETLDHMFGRGAFVDAKAVYQEELRLDLPDYAQTYWDKNIRFFDGKGPRKSFYHYGTSGMFAWLAGRYFRVQKSLYQQVQALLNAASLEQQREIYYRIESKLSNGLMEWIVNRHFTMCLLGVPRSQQELFVKEYPQGALGFIQQCLRQVFTQLPTQDNYFWRLYINGAYTADCRPEYLKLKNFDALRAQNDHIQTHNSTISGFLQKHPGTYSHYILLDHQDWLAANDVPALEEEWRLILQNSQAGTKILLRSAAKEVNFFPDFVRKRVLFEKEKTAEQHQLDRVGTYASVYLGIVR